MNLARWRRASITVWTAGLCAALLLVARTGHGDRRPDQPPAWVSRLVAVPEHPPIPVSVVRDAPAGEPGSPAAARVMTELERIRREMRESRYDHETRVNVARGRYFFDCSGMVGWVLARAAPAAYAATRSGRPRAVEFTRAILRAPTDARARGLRYIPRLADARPGDVIAWQRPRWFSDANTGHVAFVVRAPVPAPGLPPGYFLVRIADANVSGYDDDTRAAGTGGFGMGTWLLSTDPATGEANGFGMSDSASRAVFPVRIVVGRPL